MYKFACKAFELLENCIKFLQIVMVFCILMLLFYWVQNLGGYNWHWTAFMQPVLLPVIGCGEAINNGSFTWWGAVFEYKYAIAIGIYILLYFLFGILCKVVNIMQDIFEKMRNAAKKVNEDIFNKHLENESKKIQKEMKKYQVYIAIKEKNKNINIKIEEQQTILNKFLMEKTGVSPVIYGKGFLYNFHNFNYVDSVLDVLQKVLSTGVPVDYTIAIQVFGDDFARENRQLNSLISLDIYNKILCCADTLWRYNGNNQKNYKTAVVGLFAKDGVEMEVSEFVKQELFV